MASHLPSQDLGNLWPALQANPTLAVCIVDIDARVIYVSKPAAQLLFKDRPENCVGRLLYELFPTKWVDERLALLRAANEDGRPRVLRSIRNGMQVQTTVTPLRSDHEDDKPRFLLVTVEGEHEFDGPEGSFEVVESAFADLGPLDALSRRELEVLALVKQGLTNREIGKLLFRSAKTVENHIGSINQKLNTSSRVQLALIAHHAGLEVSDAHLERVR